MIYEGSYDASRRSLSRFRSPQGVRARRRGTRHAASRKLVGNRGPRNLRNPGALAQWRRKVFPASRRKKRRPLLRPLGRKSRVSAGARRDCHGLPSRGGGEGPRASCGRARTTTRFRAPGICAAGTRSPPRRRSQGRRVRRRGAQKGVTAITSSQYPAPESTTGSVRNAAKNRAKLGQERAGARLGRFNAAFMLPALRRAKKQFPATREAGDAAGRARCRANERRVSEAWARKTWRAALRS